MHKYGVFSDFPKGFSYAYLSGADVLDKYFQNLLDFYSTQPAMIQQNAIEIAEKEFAAYITNEIIISAAINQKTNIHKIHHRFYCNKYNSTKASAYWRLTLKEGKSIIILSQSEVTSNKDQKNTFPADQLDRIYEIINEIKASGIRSTGGGNA